MTGKWKCIRRTLLAIAGVLYATAAPAAGKATQAAPETSSLAMEELEVHGAREKPDRLYVPAPNTLFRFAPVRYDLFAEDLAQPIPPREVRDVTHKNGGAR